ncbi:unnamed protein product [Lymnaea stagnalis]|uniref:Reverse transcriptase zinc-binding domain-containing protein n=1 Tax=Lymnaea stagnalis TaxID=6523 RepID=A0AAV2ICR0_LYMST
MAKDSAHTHPKQDDRKVSLEAAKAIIKAQIKNEWTKQWADETTGRKVWNALKEPASASSDAWWRLKRMEQTIISKLRTGHCPTNSYLHLMGKMGTSLCRHCERDTETIEHLSVCPHLFEARELFMQNQAGPVLYGTEEQLRMTANFFNYALNE